MSQDQKGTYVEVPQEEEPKTRLQEFKEFMSTNFKGYFLALLSAAFFCTGNIIMRKANEFGVKLSGFDHLVIFFAMTLLTLPPIVIYKKENLIGAPGKRGMLMIRALFQTFAVICLYNGLLILAPSDAAALGNTSIIFTAILSRIFMKEELGIPHVIAIVFTLIGVIFISKPAVIFGSKTVVAAVNQTIEAINSTVSQTADQGDKYFSAETWAIIGTYL
jgi:drug/metabolite transporter (DMT)-like permease